MVEVNGGTLLCWKILSSRDGGADDVAPLSGLLVSQAVNGFVFPDGARARRGQRGGVGIIWLAVDGEKDKAFPIPAIDPDFERIGVALRPTSFASRSVFDILARP